MFRSAYLSLWNFARFAPVGESGVSLYGEPGVSVADVVVGEDGYATLTISLDRSSVDKITVDFTTVNGTALAGVDYQAMAGSLTFKAGQTALTVRVPILADSIDEAHEAFSFTLTKATGATIATATATVTITDNDAPAIDGPLEVDTHEDSAPVEVDLLAGVTDANGDQPWVYALGEMQRADGRPVDFSFSGSTLLLDPTQFNDLAAGAFESVVLAYQITDGSGTAIRTLTFTVEGRNDAPVVVIVEGGSGFEDTVVTGRVVTFDPDDDTLSFALDIQPAHGAVVVEADGSYSYTPAADWSGSDSFTVIVSDGQGGVVSQVVDIHVAAVNDAPVVTALEGGSGLPDTVVAGRVVAFDADGDALAYSVAADGQPQHGTVTFNPDGTYSYIPAAGWSGVDSFTALVSDGNGGTATAIVSVDVQSPAPTGLTSLMAGDEIQVNTITTGDQAHPAVAMFAEGGSVVAWESGGDVYVRRYAADGTAAGEVKINTYTANDQSRPTVATLANGGYVVSWQSNGADGSGYGISYQCFDEFGTVVGGEQIANLRKLGYEGDPAIAALDDGFVIVWEGIPPNAEAGYQIYARRFDVMGNPVEDADVPVSTPMAGTPRYPQVCGLADGGYLVTWQNNLDGDANGIYQQRYSNAGLPVGAGNLVNVSTSRDQSNPATTALADGGWVVVWQSQHEGFTEQGGVYLRVYDADGLPRTGEVHVNTFTAALQGAASIAATADGGFVVTWQSYNQDFPNPVPYGPNYGNGVFARRFGPDAYPVGGEFQVNLTYANNQEAPVVAAGPDGGFMIAWQSMGQDGSGLAIETRVYSAGTSAPVATAAHGVLGQGEAILAQALVRAGHAQGDAYIEAQLQQLSLYEFMDDTATAGSGYFTRDGVAQPAGTSIVVSAADLATVKWVAGSDTGTDSFKVRAFDGNQWSNWASGSMQTLPKIASLSASAELQPNTLVTSDQNNPDVSVLADGGFVIVWQSVLNSSQDIVAQRYDAYGNRLGTEFQVNTFTVYEQTKPVVCALAGGGFVISWQSNTEDGSTLGTFLQMYDAEGHRLGEEIRAHTYSLGDQNDPAIAALSDGGFMVVWEDTRGQSATSYDIYGQRFDANGVPVGNGEALICTNTANLQRNPEVVGLADGGYVVTWESYNEDGASSWSINQRHYNALGEPVTTADEQVNTTVAGNQQWSSVAALHEGGWVVVWQSANQDSSLDSGGVYAQIYNADGTRQGGEFRVNTYLNDRQGQPKVTGTADGGFVVTWQSTNQDFGNPVPYGAVTALEGVFAQRFDRSGLRIGSEFQVNDYNNNNQQAPAIAARSDGGFVIAWESFGKDGFGYGIGAKVYSANTQPLEVAAMNGALGQETWREASSLVHVGNSQGGAAVTGQLAQPTMYEFIDDTAASGSGSLVLDGVVQAAGTVIQVAAAQIDRLRFISGSGVGTDTYRVRAFDGNQWGAWATGSIRTLPDTTALAAGSEIVANGVATGDQMAPSVTVLADGGHVVVWQSAQGSYNDILGARFDANGHKVGVDFQVNTYSTYQQDKAAVMATADGGFVVSWQSNGEDGSDYGIYMQRFDAEARLIGAETRVNTGTAAAQFAPSMAALSDGGWMVVWESQIDTNGSTYGVWGQRYDARGNALGGEIHVNTTTVNYQRFPQVTGLTDGGWVVTWQSQNQDSSSTTGVYQQRYNADGSLHGGEVLVNNLDGAGNESVPSVTALVDGGWAVAYQSSYQEADYGVRVSIYDQFGDVVCRDVPVNVFKVGEQGSPKVAGTPDGGFVVTWQSWNQDGGAGGIYGRRFDSAGNAVSGEFLINTTTASYQQNASLAARSDGGFVVAWEHYTQDAVARWEVETRVYQVATTVSGLYQGTTGNDTLFSGTGVDTLVGGQGADIYIAGLDSGADRIDNRGRGADGDLVSFDTGVRTDQLWFQHQGDDLIVSVIGTVNSVTLVDWYLGAANHLEAFRTSDGDHLAEAQVENLVSAMAAFSPPPIGQTTLTPTEQAALDPVIAANWMSS